MMTALLVSWMIAVLPPFSAEAFETEMVRVPGGCFQMGCGPWGRDCGEDEKPAHRVCVKDVRIGAREVTQREWSSVMGSNPSTFAGCDDCPVEGVSWNDIQAFLGKINGRTGRRYRLPTEAEWEYASRAGGKTLSWSGTDDPGDLDEYAWHGGNSGMSTRPVATRRPNLLGLHDMSGNLWEWCFDVYDPGYYRTSPEENPTGPAEGDGRVIRGGSWAGNPQSLRTTERFGRPAAFRDFDIGFRLAEDTGGP